MCAKTAGQPSDRPAKNSSASLRPKTVSLTLLSDGRIQKTVKVTKQHGWSFSLPSLLVYSHGKEICYTLEAGSIAGYKESVEGMTITYTEDPTIPAGTEPDAKRQPAEAEGAGTAESKTEALLSLFPFLTVLLTLFAAATVAVLLLLKKAKKPEKDMKQRHRA